MEPRNSLIAPPCRLARAAVVRARLATLWILTLVILALTGCLAPAPQTAAPTAAGAGAPVGTAATAASAAAAPDYWPTASWKRTSPEQQGMDSARLAAMFDAIASRGLNMHSVLIIRNGYLVTEAYFSPYSAAVRQQIASVTKSVGGMLTGIAIARGHIKSVNEPVLSFYRTTKGPAGELSGLRGHWEGGDAFVVDQATLGDNLQYQSRLTVLDDELHIEVHELVNGYTEKMTGRLEP